MEVFVMAARHVAPTPLWTRVEIFAELPARTRFGTPRFLGRVGSDWVSVEVLGSMERYRIAEAIDEHGSATFDSYSAYVDMANAAELEVVDVALLRAAVLRGDAGGPDDGR